MKTYSDKTRSIVSLFNSTIVPIILGIAVMVVSAFIPDGLLADDFTETYAHDLVLNIPWGPAPDEMGIHNLSDGSRYGPGSFDIDMRGRMYILDTVNRAVKVYARDGRLQNHFPVDIQSRMGFLDVDNSGGIWVSDPENRIVLKYTSEGVIRKRIVYNRGWYNLVEPFISVRSDSVQLAISRIDSTGIITPSGDMGEPVIQGKRATIPKHEQVQFIGMASGNFYNCRAVPNKPPEMEILKAGHLLATVKFQDIDALYSVTYLGEDSFGSFYVKLTSLLRNVTHIRKYDRALRHVATIYYIPFDGKYKLDDIANIRIDVTGDIYCLFWLDEGMHMLKWSPVGPEKR